MKGKILTLMGVGMLTLAVLLASVPAMALSADDFNFSGTSSSGDVTDSNADLVSSSVSASGDTVTMTLTVRGSIINNDENYTYGFLIMDLNNDMVGATFSNGEAEYLTSNGLSNCSSSVDGSSLSIFVPLAAFSQFVTINAATANADSPSSEDTIVMELNDNGLDDGGSGSGDDNGAGSGTGDSGGSGYGGGSGGFDNFPMPVNGPDPLTQTPTDTSISVSITYVHLVMQNKSNEVEMDMTIRGTTSGVDHVALGWSMYYKNGTHEWQGSWTPGPFEMKSNTDLPFGGGHVYEFYFKNTSAEWKTWEYKMHMTMPRSNYSGNDSGSTDFFNDIDHMRLYARAYSDTAGNNWNQGYYDLSVSVSDDGNTISGGTDVNSDGGNGSSTPGFEAVLAVSAISLAGIAYGYRRKH